MRTNQTLVAGLVGCVVLLATDVGANAPAQRITITRDNATTAKMKFEIRVTAESDKLRTVYIHMEQPSGGENISRMTLLCRKGSEVVLSVPIHPERYLNGTLTAHLQVSRELLPDAAIEVPFDRTTSEGGTIYNIMLASFEKADQKPNKAPEATR